MQLTQFYHRHSLHTLAKHPNFYLFELSIWLQTLGESLIWVFVPILLYTTGYPVEHILVYYLIFNIIDVPLNFAVFYLTRWLGARKVMLCGMLAILLFFVLLNTLTAGNWQALLVLATLAAIYDTFFWISHLYLFIEINREGMDTGKTTGAIEGVRKLANIIGPGIGALVLIAFGKSYLIFASLILFALSAIPLFKMRHIHDKPQHEKLSWRKFFVHPTEQRDYLAVSLWGIHNEVNSILWPLFIFTALGTFQSVAAIPIIMSLTTAALSFVAGNLTKKHAYRMVTVGSLCIAFAWVLRAVFDNHILYYATVFLVGFFSLFVAIPIDGSITKRGLEKGSLAAATFRNTLSMASRIPLYLVLIALVTVFKVSFAMAAASLLLIFFVALLFKTQGQKHLHA